MSDDIPQGDGSGSDGRAKPAVGHSKEGDFWAFEVFHTTRRREQFLMQHLKWSESNNLFKTSETLLPELELIGLTLSLSSNSLWWTSYCPPYLSSCNPNSNAGFIILCGEIVSCK